MHQAETPTDDTTVAEEFFNSAGSCFCYYVKIFGRTADNQITHRSTYDICVITAFPEVFYYIVSVFINFFFWYLMFFFCINNGLLF